MRFVTVALLGLLAGAFVAEDAAARSLRDPGAASVAAGERAQWNRPWEYDSGSDNDRRPELPYFQQGRGQQTGGTARNLVPYDGLTLAPR